MHNVYFILKTTILIVISQKMTFPSHSHFTLYKHIFFILFIPLNNNNILNFEIISELDRVEYLESRPGVLTFNFLLYLK